MAFWLDRGIDGFRVDAVPYLIEREGTNCENLPETHEFLKEMRQFVDSRYPGTLLLAEANQWPSDLLPYFGQGDEFHMAFNFPLMPRLFMAIRREDQRPIIDIINQMPEIPVIVPVGPLSAQPRRAHAGNGHGRRTRLHVHRICPRSPDAAQPGDSPPARAA